MDRTVPPAAAYILTEIYKPESKSNYEVISSFKQHLLPKPITKMTLGELLADMGNWQKRYGTKSSAAGAGQIIKKTLQGLVVELGLSLKQKFDPNLQDRLCYHLLRRRGYDAWKEGRITDVEFAKRLAQEWASLPVLTGTKNYRGVNIKRGTSYYAGDGLNSAHVTADYWENVLKKAYRMQGAVDVKPADTKTTATTKVIVAASAGTAVVGGAAEATKTITDWSPVIDLASGISRYGPMAAAAIVVSVVVVIIARKIWKG